MISQCEDRVEPSVEMIDRSINYEHLKEAYAKLPKTNNNALYNIAIYLKGDQNSNSCCIQTGEVVAILHVSDDADFEDLQFQKVLKILAKRKRPVAMYSVGKHTHGWWLTYSGNNPKITEHLYPKRIK